MAITTANKFWLSLSPQDVLKGNVGIAIQKDLVNTLDIKASTQPFDFAINMAHPVLPKFQDLYLMVVIKSDNLGSYDEFGQNRYYYDNLRKGVKSDYCNFYYDSDKYTISLITSSHNEMTDATGVEVLSKLFANKKLYRILDIYITDIVKPTTNDPMTYNIKVRYLAKNK